MKFIRALIVVLMASPLALKAQRNFQPGYIVNFKGDTTTALIDYKEWKNNPTTIDIKNGDLVSGHTVETLKAFGITGLEQFERFSASFGDTTTVKTVFLKVVYKGKVLSMYCYNDDIRSRFYIKEGNSQSVQELINYVKFKDEQEGRQVNRYRVQLQYIGQKNNISNSLSMQISNVRYFEKDLLKVVKAINGDNTNTLNTNSESSIRLFAGLGVNVSTLMFMGKEVFPNGTKSSNIMPRINFGVDFLKNKTLQKLIFRTELSLTANSFGYKDVNLPATTFNLSGPDDAKASLAFKQSIISLSPQLVYNIYNTDAFKVFINAGVALNYSSYNKYTYKAVYSNTTKEDVGYPIFEKMWMSIIGRVGCTINKKIEVNLGYMPSSPITRYTGTSAELSAINGSINFLLGK